MNDLTGEEFGMAVALAVVEEAAAGRVDAQKAFDEAILTAVAAGASFRAVAKAAGLTHGRVAQIVAADRQARLEQ